MIVSTGKLRPSYCHLENSHGKEFVCFSYLLTLFDIPSATAYWLEVSDRRQGGQWAGGLVKVDHGNEIVWRADGRDWKGLHYPAQRFLRRHFKLTTKPKRLWCRLMYE